MSYIIFTIRNRENNKRYFAICRKDKYLRVIRRHKLLLEYDLHPNKHLQSSYNHYPMYQLFSYEIHFTLLEYNDAEKLLKELIVVFNTADGNHGYNHIGVDLLNS